MNKFQKLKAIIEKEYKEKQSDLEKYYLEHEKKGVTPYRKEGWRDCLDYLLSEISLMENIYQFKHKNNEQEGDSRNV